MMPQTVPVHLLAETYAAAGFRVFPVDMRPDERGKPRKTPFHGYLWKERATLDPEVAVSDVLAAYVAAGPGNEQLVGIGWALGLDGYVALDLDGPAPPFWGSLPETLTNVTAKGQHLIYRVPGGRIVSNSTGKFPSQDWGDVRGAGGYIVVAGHDREGLQSTSLADAVEFPRPDWLTDAGASEAPVPSSAVEGWVADHSGTARRRQRNSEGSRRSSQRGDQGSPGTASRWKLRTGSPVKRKQGWSKPTSRSRCSSDGGATSADSTAGSSGTRNCSPSCGTRSAAPPPTRSGSSP